MDDSTSHRDQHLLNVWWFQLWHEEDTQAIGHYLVPMSDASLWLTALQVQALDTTKQAFNSHRNIHYLTYRLNLTGRLPRGAETQARAGYALNIDLSYIWCKTLLLDDELYVELSLNVFIFIQFLKEYECVKYCQNTFLYVFILDE